MLFRSVGVANSGLLSVVTPKSFCRGGDNKTAASTVECKMNSSESSLAAAAATLVGHPHEGVHVLLVQAPRATMLSCHRLSVSEGFILSRLVITGGKVGSVILVTVSDSASSMSGTSTWFNTMFVD